MKAKNLTHGWDLYIPEVDVEAEKTYFVLVYVLGVAWRILELLA